MEIQILLQRLNHPQTVKSKPVKFCKCKGVVCHLYQLKPIILHHTAQHLFILLCKTFYPGNTGKNVCRLVR